MLLEHIMGCRAKASSVGAVYDRATIFNWTCAVIDRAYRRRIVLAVLWIAATSVLDAASIRGRFSFAGQNGVSAREQEAGAVVWLVPLTVQAGSRPERTPSGPHMVLTQKSKHFDPHVMVVPVGTTVDFPNRDPFFHNVFSLFDGKRFDLGLYEAGSSRSVRFDRAGICYIFCNIHPEMSAVIVVVDSPYFGVSTKSGEFEIQNVPAGRYQLNVWAEHCLPKALQELSRELTVGDETAVLGTIQVPTSRDAEIHPNKYGKSYDPQVFSRPGYIHP
jgi:plastocyanin